MSTSEAGGMLREIERELARAKKRLEKCREAAKTKSEEAAAAEREYRQVESRYGQILRAMRQSCPGGEAREASS